MRTVSRLRLLYLCDLRSSSTVLPSLLATLVETNTPPSKIYCRYLHFSQCAFRAAALDNPVVLMVQYIFGGGGRDRTAVQESFTSKELQQFLFKLYPIESLTRFFRGYSSQRLARCVTQLQILLLNQYLQ